MTRLISLCLLVMLTACVSNREAVEIVSIGEDVSMRLPLPPSYPGTIEDRARVRISANGEGVTVNASMRFSPTQALVRIAHPTGATLLDIEWNESGIFERRSNQLPSQFRSEELLAALFIALWPAAQIDAALPAHASLVQFRDGRAIEALERTVLTIRQTRNAIQIDHYDYGYSFEIAGLNF